MGRWSAPVAVLMILGLHLPARAVCPPTPAWATCVGDKLQVDAGGSYGTVDFELADLGDQWSQATAVGDPLANASYGGQHPYATLGSCTPQDWIVYDLTHDPGLEVDGYSGAGCSAPGCCDGYGECGPTNDLLHIWGITAKRHVFIKNFDAANAFRSEAGDHTDVLQQFQGTDFGGWAVLQDSTFTNSDDQHLQIATNEDYVPTLSGTDPSCGIQNGTGGPDDGMKGLVLQNVMTANLSAFNADCLARKGPGEFCPASNNFGAVKKMALWFIETSINPCPALYDRVDPVVIVGTNQPPCYLDPSWVGNRYFYGSIEQALSASYSTCQSKPISERPDECDPDDFPHQRPPFIQLSEAGWKCGTVDSDGDGVKDGCDSCVHVPNPPVQCLDPDRTYVNSGGGWQLDDDRDGIGNACDCDLDNDALPVCTTQDINHSRASLGQLLSADACGTSGTLLCVQFDMVPGAGESIVTVSDVNSARAMLGVFISSLSCRDLTNPCTQICTGPACP